MVIVSIWLSSALVDLKGRRTACPVVGPLVIAGAVVLTVIVAGRTVAIAITILAVGHGMWA